MSQLPETVTVMAKLRKIREAKGLTQADVSARMNRSDACVSMIENATRDPGLSTFIRYLRALGFRLSCEEIRDDR